MLTGATIINRWDLSDQPPVQVEMVVAPGTTIYQGAMVAIDGNDQAENANGTLQNVGFARDTYTAGQTAILESRHFVYLTISGADQSNIGDPVYATDENSFQLSSSSATLIGYIHDYEADSGQCIVHVTLTQTVV